MKRKIGYFGILMMIILCISSVICMNSAFADLTEANSFGGGKYNIIQAYDPSFELTEGGIFEFTYGAERYSRVDSSDKNVRTGNGSVLLDYTSTDTIIPFAANFMLLENMTLPIVSLGQKYTLSFWTKATDGLELTQNLYIYAMGLNDNQTFELGSKAYTSDQSGEWQKFELEFTLPKTYGEDNKAVRGIRMVFFGGSVEANGRLFIDDIALEKVNNELTGHQVDSINLDVRNNEIMFAGFPLTIDTDTYVENEGSASYKVVAKGDQFAGLYYIIPKEKLANDIYIFSFMVKLENVTLSTASYPFGLLAKPTLNKDMADYGGEVIYYDGYDLRNHVQSHIAVRQNMKEDGVFCGDNGVALSTTPRTTDGWIKVEIPFNVYGIPDGSSADADGNVPLSADEVTGMAMKINFGCVSGTMYFDNFKVYRSGTPEPDYRSVSEETDTSVAYNYINNGGFEQNSDWFFSGSVENSGIAATGAYEGKSCVQYTLSENTSLYQDITVFPIFDRNILNQKSKTYELSAYVKLGETFADSASDPFGLFATVFDEEGNKTELTLTEINGLDANSSDWQKISATFLVEEKYNDVKWNTLRVGVQPGGATGIIYLDNVAVNAYGVDTENKVDNVFTESVTSSTQAGANYGGSDYKLVFESTAGNLSVDPTVTYTGFGGSIKYSSTNEDMAVFYISIPLEVLADDVYYLTYYMKGEGLHTSLSGNTGFWVSPMNLDSYGLMYPEVIQYLEDNSIYGGDYGYYRTFANGHKNVVGFTPTPTDYEWKKYTLAINPWSMVSESTNWETKAPVYFDENGSLCLYFRMMGLSGDLWVDEIKLFRAGTQEPVYRTATDLDFGGAPLNPQVAYGEDFVFPDVRYRYLDENDEIQIGSIEPKISLEYKASIYAWDTIFSESDNTTENRTFKPQKHGTYRMIYGTELDGKYTELIYYIEVVDTLQDIVLDLGNFNSFIKYGDALDLSDLIVKAIMSKSATKGVVVDDYTYECDYEPNDAPGDYKVTIRYYYEIGGEKTAEFTISVLDIASSIEIKTLPGKLVYNYGEAFDLTGAVVSGEMQVASATQNIDIKYLTVKDYNPNKVGKQNVKIVYLDKETAAFEVTVNDAVDKIEIDTTGAKLEYKTGESLDVSGLVVKKVMKSGEKITLNSSEYTVITEFDKGSEAGNYTVIVKATLDGTEYNVSYNISVVKGGCGAGSVMTMLYAMITTCAIALLVMKK